MTHPTFEFRDPQLDGDALVARIRERARRRMAEDGAAPLAAVLASAHRDEPGWRTMREHLEGIIAQRDPAPKGVPPVEGTAPSFPVRDIVRKLLHPYHQALLARQAHFNSHVAYLLGALLPWLQLHDETQRLLREQAEGMRRQLDDVLRELATIRDRLEKAEHDIASAATLAELDTRQRRVENAQAVATAETGRRLEALQQAMALHKGRVRLLLNELHRSGPGTDQGVAPDGGMTGWQELLRRSQPLDDDDYERFEDLFRGSRDEIRERQRLYCSLFVERYGPDAWRDRPSQPAVLDVGCGRGEFLELLKAAGVAARGIDHNESAVRLCRARGLEVEQAEMLGYLRSLADRSLGGIISCQVIEHLSVERLIEFIHLCRQKLRDDGVAVLETVNPLNLVVGATSFYLDPTHVRPVHPTMLQFLAESAGFSSTEIRYLAPVPEANKLQPVAEIEGPFAVINANVGRLNDLLFAPQDYALIAVA